MTPRRSFLSRLWQRWPITIITITLTIIGWSYRYFSASSATMLRPRAAARDITPRPASILPATQPCYTEPARARHARASAFRRRWVAPNEVDYVADDVTVRIFNPAPKSRPTKRWDKEVNIGDDVTVRYFAGHDSLAETIAPSSVASK
jgi:hypothetical protein